MNPARLAQGRLAEKTFLLPQEVCSSVTQFATMLADRRDDESSRNRAN
jgi:hypothetical protein